MASVPGTAEELEAADRIRVEGLREEATESAEVLEAAAEIELDRQVIAREELVEALVRREGHSDPLAALSTPAVVPVPERGYGCAACGLRSPLRTGPGRVYSSPR